MILRVRRIFLKLLRSPTVTSSSPPPRRRADGTLPRHLAGSEFEGRHRIERVLELGGVVFSVLDRSVREDVRLHQPRFITLPLSIYEGT